MTRQIQEKKLRNLRSEIIDKIFLNEGDVGSNAT
jgi:hypothetical protein